MRPSMFFNPRIWFRGGVGYWNSASEILKRTLVLYRILFCGRRWSLMVGVDAQFELLKLRNYLGRHGFFFRPTLPFFFCLNYMSIKFWSASPSRVRAKIRNELEKWSRQRDTGKIDSSSLRDLTSVFLVLNFDFGFSFRLVF